MTLIETRLISNVTNRGLTALSEAWSSVREMKFTISSVESNPQLVQTVPPNEVVIVIGFEIKTSNRAGTMNLCIPYNVIEPVMEALAAQSWFSINRSQYSKEALRRLSRSLADAGLTLTGLLAETTITMDELVHLSVGDVITTNKRASEPVVVCVEGRPKFTAYLGQFRGARALRIASTLADTADPADEKQLKPA